MNYSLRFALLFHCLLITAFASREPLIYGVLTIVLLYGLISNISVFKNMDKSEVYLSVIYFSVIVVMTAVNFFRNPIVSFHLGISTMVFLSAVVFTRHAEIYYKASKYSLILFQAIVLSYVAFKGLENYPLDVPFDHMVEGASANGITSYAILLQINLSVVSFLLYRRITLITPIVTLIIALLGYGRGSIISAFMIILVNLYSNFALKSRKQFLVNILLTISFVFLLSLYYLEEITVFLNANTKLGAGIVDVSRAQIIEEYFGRINWITFFTGADYANGAIDYEFNNNPHNSFIRAHHIFGLPYLLFILVFPFYNILKNKGVLEIFFYTLMVIILFFRIFSEPVIFPTIFDFYFLSMILLIGKSSKLYQVNSIWPTKVY